MKWRASEQAESTHRQRATRVFVRSRVCCSSLTCLCSHCCESPFCKLFLQQIPGSARNVATKQAQAVAADHLFGGQSGQWRGLRPRFACQVATDTQALASITSCDHYHLTSRVFVCLLSLCKLSSVGRNCNDRRNLKLFAALQRLN